MIKGKIPPATIDTILERLASDDAFREGMLGDPAGTLGALGVEVDASQVPAVRSLPSRQAIAEAHDTLKEKIADSSMLVFLLLK